MSFPAQPAGAPGCEATWRSVVVPLDTTPPTVVTHVTTTPAPIVIRPAVDWPREITEAGWHIAIIPLTLPFVARTLVRHRTLSVLATAALLAGAVWHCVAALRELRTERA
jgi:hypothetical protein